MPTRGTSAQGCSLPEAWVNQVQRDLNSGTSRKSVCSSGGWGVSPSSLKWYALMFLVTPVAEFSPLLFLLFDTMVLEPKHSQVAETGWGLKWSTQSVLWSFYMSVEPTFPPSKLFQARLCGFSEHAFALLIPWKCLCSMRGALLSHILVSPFTLWPLT